MQISSNNYYMNAYAASATYTQGSFSVNASYLEITGGTSSVQGKDGVDLSSQAKELADRIKNLDVFSCIFPNNDVRKSAKTLDEVNGDFKNDFANFSSMFGKMTEMLGLGSGDSITMGLNGKGGMDIAGTDQSAVDKLNQGVNTSSTSTFTKRFAVMAARAALVDAGNTVDGFKDSYANDPFAAIQNNIEALKERLLGFRTEASGGEMNYGFIRSFSAAIEYSSVSTSADAAAEEAAAETEATEVA